MLLLLLFSSCFLLLNLKAVLPDICGVLFVLFLVSFFFFFLSFFIFIFIPFSWEFFLGGQHTKYKVGWLTQSTLFVVVLFFSLSVGLSCCEKSFVAVFCQHADLVGWGTSLMFDASLSSDGADACQAWLLRPATHQPKLSRLQDVCCKYLWSFDLTFPSNFLYYI